MGAPTCSPRLGPRWGCSLRFGAFAFPRSLFRFPWPGCSTSAPAFASATGSRMCALSLLCLGRPPALPARWAVGKATHTSATFSSLPNIFFGYGCTSSLVEPGAAGAAWPDPPPPPTSAGRCWPPARARAGRVLPHVVFCSRHASVEVCRTLVLG